MYPKERLNLANAKAFCLGMFFKGKIFKAYQECFVVVVVVVLFFPQWKDVN